jgi:cold shock CspA family protein
MTKPLLKGVLKTWKEDRGFGFITPDNGGRDLFIHISSLGQVARRPVPGDIIYYQVVRDRNGKFRAVNASIEGVEARDNSATGSQSNVKWIIAGVVGLLVIAAVAVFVYFRLGGVI